MFPDTPQTLDRTCYLLNSGVGKGVFLFGGCSTGAITPQTCSPPVTQNNDPTNQLFLVNAAMASVNPINGAYVAVGYTPNPNDAPGGPLVERGE